MYENSKRPNPWSFRLRPQYPSLWPARRLIWWTIALVFASVIATLFVRTLPPTPGLYQPVDVRTWQLPTVQKELESRFVSRPTDVDLDSDASESKALLPKTPAQTCNRVLSSPVGNWSSDGLGHRFTVTVYELLLAAVLDLGYLHRVASYGSLTPDHDPEAVERMFGWTEYEDVRSDVFHQACNIERRVGHCKLGEKDPFEYCASLKKGAPFKHLVHIPPNLTACPMEVGKSLTLEDCLRPLQEFVRKHDKCDTLFQAVTDRCSTLYRYGSNMPGAGIVIPWLRKRYWATHRTSTKLVSADESRREMPAPVGKSSESSVTGRVTRILPFSEARLQVAVHIRRGDFFHYNKTLVPDEVYAIAVATIIKSAQEVSPHLGVDVNVFSEGAPRTGQFVPSKHNISDYTHGYVTENGTVQDQPQRYWTQLLERLGGSNNVAVQAFISTDTINSVHAMICSDVFVGGYSGLIHIISAISRAVVFVPGNRDRSRFGFLMYDAEQRDPSLMFNLGLLKETVKARLPFGTFHR